MNTEYRYDAHALEVAQKIMECRATAAVDGWPDVRLKAAIQCLVIEAMKWAAQSAAPVAFIDGNISDETMKQLLEELKCADRGRIMVKPAPAVQEGWKLVPIEPTAEMMLHNSSCQHHAWDDEDCSVRQLRRNVWGNMVSAAPAPGGEHG